MSRGKGSTTLILCVLQRTAALVQEKEHNRSAFPCFKSDVSEKAEDEAGGVGARFQASPKQRTI